MDLDCKKIYLKMRSLYILLALIVAGGALISTCYIFHEPNFQNTASMDQVRMQFRFMRQEHMIMVLFQDYDRFKIINQDYRPSMELILQQLDANYSELLHRPPPFVETIQTVGDCNYFIRFELQLVNGELEYAHYLCKYIII